MFHVVTFTNNQCKRYFPSPVCSKWTVNITMHLIWLLNFWLCMFYAVTVIKNLCKRHFHPSHPLKIGPKYDIASYLVEVLVMCVQSGDSYSQCKRHFPLPAPSKWALNNSSSYFRTEFLY
jgi:hypothetical protein